MGTFDSVKAGRPFATPATSLRFLATVGVAVALHLAMLVPAQRTSTGAQAIGLAPAMSVRLLAPTDAKQVESAVVEQPRAVLQQLPAANAPERASTGTARTPVREAPRAAVSFSRPISERSAPMTLPSAAVKSVSEPASAAMGKSVERSPALPAAPGYLMGGTLDPGPRPLQDIEPTYPQRAGQLQGIVVLRLLIDERGVVDNAAVVRSSPPGFFEDAAIEAFGAARFSPGMSFGVAVKSQVTIEVEFTPINRGAAVSGTTY